MSQLQQRGKNFSIVVNVPNTLTTQEDIDTFMSKLDNDLKRITNVYGWYASIWHTETDKTLHCHVVIHWDMTLSVGRFLKLFAYETEIPIECVSIELCYSLVGAVQYLTHKNRTDKYQYSFSLINTSNESVLMSYYNAESQKNYSMQELYDLVVDFGYQKHQIMIFLGIENWNRYRLIINDFIGRGRGF